MSRENSSVSATPLGWRLFRRLEGGEESLFRRLEAVRFRGGEESLIFWGSYRIKSVCLSSCEAEFVACSDLGRELAYVASFQREISAKIVEPGEKKRRFENADRQIFWNHPEKRLLCDNKGAIFAAHNSEQKRQAH